LLSDGTHIFYQRYENGRYSVASVPVDGGESTDVRTNLRNPELCDLNANDRRMLLRDLVGTRDELNPVYIQPEGGNAARIGDFLAYDAAWYPDGKSILYSADGVVYSSDTSGTARQRLFSVPGNAYWFRWSPDGKRLRFTVIDKTTEQTSIWEAKANGDRPHMLFPEVHHQLCCGSWTGDGKFFYFQARVDNRFEIWAVRNQDGLFYPKRHRPFPLISGAEYYRGPLPSRDGKKLFMRTEAPKDELVRLESKIRELLLTLPSISVLTLAYSKDGNWIAYTSLADKNLWRCHADGT
jgi:Tol biopolymer transport system component